MKKLIIYDNQGNPTKELNVPKFVDESLENQWAVRMFKSLRAKAEDKNQVDHWDIEKK